MSFITRIMEQSGCLLVAAVCLLFVSGSLANDVHLRTTNVDSQYGRWNKSSIPYCIDADYSPAERSTIEQAVQIMRDALSNQIIFTPVDCTDTRYKIRFSALTGGPGSAPSTVSKSWPGVHLLLFKNQTEQIVTIARDAVGCSTDVHCALKFIAVVLGKRLEHLRGNRDSYITVINSNIAVANTYDKYTTTQAYWDTFPYDYCSITHNQPEEFAAAGTVAFTMPSGTVGGPNCIPKLNNISNTDCKLISMMYSLDTARCAPLNCAAQLCSTTTISTTTSTTPIPSTTGTTATTAATTTTDTTTTATTTTTGSTTTVAPLTCSTTATVSTIPTTTAPPTCSVNFCATPTPTIDEATILWNNRYYMFSGDCAVEIDLTNRIIGPSVPISYVLPGVTGPIRSIFTDQQRGGKVTYVRTDAAEYTCWSFGCSSITPYDDTKVRWEWIRQDTNGNVDATDPYVSYAFHADVNAYKPDEAGSFLIATFDLCGFTNGNCKITQGWSAAYMVKGGSGLNYINVIGKGDDGNQYLESLFWAQDDYFVALNNGILLSDGLKCSTV